MAVGKVKFSKLMNLKLGDIPRLKIMYYETKNHQTDGVSIGGGRYTKSTGKHLPSALVALVSVQC
jgi:hypothetical protein